MELIIRKFDSSDDVVALTDLIHSAYASHAACGLRYWGTYQKVEDTVRRISTGICLVACVNEEYIGTGLFRWHQPSSPVEIYRDPSVWTLAQFCVSPKYKGRSIGKKSMLKASNFCKSVASQLSR